jgi:hypothetical protein
MKILLACLMCLVLPISQAFAISGGPFPSPHPITGTYAGVFVPIPTVLDPGPPPVTMTDNSLALFTLSVQKIGLASGTAAVFRNGINYTGSIQASADPDSAKLRGALTAISGANSAKGNFLNTRIIPNHNTNSTASTRVRGKASITYTNSLGDSNGDSGGPIVYQVHAFKQADVN